MNKKQKDLVKIFTLIFVLVFFVMNWNDLSWIFNYRAVSGLAYDFFNPYPDSRFLVASNNQVPLQQPVILKNAPEKIKKIYPYSDKENSLEIPALKVVAPLMIGQSTDTAALEKDLNKGVVYYPGSVLPREVGHIVILGHSAPPNWPRIKYDWVFSEINNLNVGDEITLHFNNRKYIYRVKEKAIVAPGQDVQPAGLSENNVLTIISCWPPGKNYKRIAVSAQLEEI